MARVVLGDFVAAVDTWIVAAAWDAFIAQVVQLERTRRGEAVLEGVPTHELHLRIAAIDRAGHMSVAGTLRTFYAAGAGSHRPSSVTLEFGDVEFDPTLLPVLIRELSRGPSADAVE